MFCISSHVDFHGAQRYYSPDLQEAFFIIYLSDPTPMLGSFDLVLFGKQCGEISRKRCVGERDPDRMEPQTTDFK